MVTAYIGVGSNLGNREKNIKDAETLFRRTEKITSLQSSPLYETEPLGGPPQGKYLNAVWRVETQAVAEELFTVLVETERQLGRIRSVKNAPRIIDLDLLFYDQAVIHKPGLEVPHPRLHERWFVLKPLADLDPELQHPVFKEKIKNLLMAIQ